MRVPTRSEGTRSGVNWMRRNEPRMVRASVFTVSVFARPGTPSTSRCPCARIATSTRSRKWSWPTTTFLTSYRMRSSRDDDMITSEGRKADRGRRGLDRHRERDAGEHALVAGVENAGDDADHLARGGDERPARAARVRGRVELDETAERAPAVGRLVLAVEARDHARGHRRPDAEGKADRDDVVARLQVRGGAERRRHQIVGQRARAQHGEIVLGLHRDDFRLRVLAGREVDRDALGALD